MSDSAKMRLSMRRLSVITNHLTRRMLSTLATPEIVVSPGQHMADDKVNIWLQGLHANQMVKLEAAVNENGKTFRSHAVFSADSNGQVDVTSDESVSGTYTGKDAMGLFWSLQPEKSQARFVKKDVTTPARYSIKLFEHKPADMQVTAELPLAETSLEMCYLKKGMKRIPVNEGKFRGTIFIPEGPGPFPGIIDMYGGLVSIVETRAALLACHGYATYALTYLYREHLPDDIKDIDVHYLTDAAKWFCKQPFVNEESIATVGLCMGGSMALCLASLLPQVRAAVNINGTPVYPKPPLTDLDRLPHKDKFGNVWPQSHRIFSTEEGFAVRDIWEGPDLKPIPAWNHGAKILAIIGEDDKQVHPKWHSYFRDNCPESARHNIELASYPGAGHLIEPPYSPLCRNYAPNPRRVDGIYFIPAKYREDPMMAGGIHADHACAQEDAWGKILTFLDANLTRVDNK